MRVVADSHIVVWYTQDPEQLTMRADDALREAEASEGIAVSVASLVDLWYVTRTTKSVTQETLQGIRALLDHSPRRVAAVPVTIEVSDAFEAISLDKLRDPWDRLIVATAQVLRVPLVTADERILRSSLVEVIW